MAEQTTSKQYYDYNKSADITLKDGPIQKLKEIYKVSDSGSFKADNKVIHAKMGDGSYKDDNEQDVHIEEIVGLGLWDMHKDKVPWTYGSVLVGVRGDGVFDRGKAQFDKPVFHTNKIPGQEKGSFWTFEDDATKRMTNTIWMNMTPMMENGNPKTDKDDGVYLFEWAANIGDSAYRGAQNVGEGAKQGVIAAAEGALIGAEALAVGSLYKGGKKTKKRKMRKLKKTFRKKNKRKTYKGGKQRKSKQEKKEH